MEVQYCTVVTTHMSQLMIMTSPIRCWRTPKAMAQANGPGFTTSQAKPQATLGHTLWHTPYSTAWPGLTHGPEARPCTSLLPFIVFLTVVLKWDQILSYQLSILSGILALTYDVIDICFGRSSKSAWFKWQHGHVPSSSGDSVYFSKCALLMIRWTP